MSKYITTGNSTKKFSNETSPGNRVAIGIGVVATTALVSLASSKALANIHHAEGVENVPAIGEPHRYFSLDDTFTVGDKQVTINDLTEAAKYADTAHPADVPLTLEMLERQIPVGKTDAQITPDMIFRLPDDASIGHEYVGE